MNSLPLGFQFQPEDLANQCIDYSQNSVEFTCRSPSSKPPIFEPEYPKTTNDSSMSQFIEQEAETLMNYPYFESYEDPQASFLAPPNFFTQTSAYFNSSPEKNEECLRPIAQVIEEEKSPEGFIAAKMFSQSSLGHSQTQKDFEFINDHNDYTMEIEEVQVKGFDMKSFAKGESSQRAEFLTCSPEQILSSVDDSSTTSRNEQNVRKNLPVTTVFAVVSSVKKLLQNGSCPEEQFYLREIVYTSFPTRPERNQFLDYLEGCKAGKSGRTWNKLKEQFKGKNVNMNRVLMRCVEAFLCPEGEGDLERYIKEGKRGNDTKMALRNEKGWFIEKLRQTFPEEFAWE